MLGARQTVTHQGVLIIRGVYEVSLFGYMLVGRYRRNERMAYAEIEKCIK